MKKIIFFMLIAFNAYGQEINVTIGITDGVKVDSLLVGLDQSATDGIDASLGEESLPPLPPTGVFDARLNLGDNESTKKDYRTGGIGTIANIIHEIQYQPGSGTSITLSWNFPQGITGRLQDIILGNLIDVSMNGSGNFTVTNPSVFNKLKLTMIYYLAPPNPPDLVSPINNSVSISLNPSFVWENQSVVSSYAFQLATENAFIDTLVNIRGLTDTVYYASNLEYNTKYFWRANASNSFGKSDWSDVFVFTTDYEVPGPPELFNPENNLKDTELQLSFKWSDTETSTTGSVVYDLIYSTLSDFSSSNIEINDINSTEYQLNSELVGSTKYFWKVRSKNTAGESDWSEVFNFTTKILLPQPPSSVYPENGLGNQSLTPELGWNATQYAEFYNLYVSADSNFSNTLYQFDSLSTTNKRLLVLDGAKKYFWKVKAGNKYGFSDYSSTFNFTTVSINWKNSINISNNASESKNLVIGTADLATDAVDSSYGEVVLPPLPPSDIFDVRLALPNNQDFSLADFRSSESSVLQWEINIQSGLGGYPVNLTWDNKNFPEGNFSLVDLITGTIVNVDMKNQNSYSLTNSSINKLIIKYSLLVCKSIAVNSGWNLISIPIIPDDASVATIFPESNSNAYYFNSGYQTASEFETQKGYWLRFPQSLTREICGNSANSDSMPIKSGWNLIGSFENDVELTNVDTYPSNIINSFFYGFNNGYTQTNSLLVGKGYWVKANADGVLKISSDTTNNKFNFNNEWAKIIVSDNLNSIRELYIVNSSVDNRLYELPPLPPNGIFDLRFGDNSFVQSSSSSAKQIVLTNAEFPVRLSVTGTTLRLFDNNNSFEKILRDSDEIVISDNKLNRIFIEEVLYPKKFELYQNYPNPFNPTTIIKYGIPEDAKVRLDIYNALGQRVRTLIDTQMEAGYHEILLNANQLASGVYFYRIHAGNFIDTKKMLLVK